MPIESHRNDATQTKPNTRAADMAKKEYILNNSLMVVPRLGRDEGIDQDKFKTDLEIWNAFISGDKSAFVYLYNNYANQLLKFGIQFAPREMVKDAIQDLFVYLKDRKWKGEQVNRIAPYLYKSLYRILLEKIKKGQLLKSLDFEHGKSWQINVSTEIDVIETGDKSQQAKLLKVRLNELSPKQKQAILLYFYEGFTYEEVKDIMQLSHRSSARKLIYRALETLRGAFKE